MRNKRNAFTFVELLIVIAVIGILVSLLQPALQRTVWGAKHAVCMNNLKRTFHAFAVYYEDSELMKPWHVANGTFDGPHEANSNWRNGNPGNPAKVLVNQAYLDNAENLFCPLSQLNVETHYHANARNNTRKTGKASFWASYSYVYKGIRNKGAMVADVQEGTWLSFEKGYGIDYPQPFRYHYNLLYEDGSVIFLTDEDREFLNYFPDWRE